MLQSSGTRLISVISPEQPPLTPPNLAGAQLQAAISAASTRVLVQHRNNETNAQVHTPPAKRHDDMTIAKVHPQKSA